MSVLYCTIPHFAAALARRDAPDEGKGPLVLVGPERRVLGCSAEAAACGVVAGMAARTAEVRCPAARLREADVARCRAEAEVLLQVLEGASSRVEPHGWGAAYVDLGDLARGQADAVALCRELGQAVRRELGDLLQPALGWDSNKFTAQAAARRTEPGHLRALEGVRERAFLRPLPVAFLPLAGDALQRLRFLGLLTLGQYAALSAAAVWQQFGRAGVLAHHCARGEDDRPVVPRWQAPELAAEIEFEAPLVERERLVVALRRLVSPLLAELRASLRACGLVRLAVHFEDGSAQEKERTFLLPVAQEERVVRALEQLLRSTLCLRTGQAASLCLAGLRWPAGATALAVTLAQIQDAVAEQLTLFPLRDERQEKLRQVERYLAARFGANCLRRAVMDPWLDRQDRQPGAPLPEWRVSWLADGEP
jgi:nucleotidyltransferase/DNA polymerase involved in DNA repair